MREKQQKFYYIRFFSNICGAFDLKSAKDRTIFVIGLKASALLFNANCNEQVFSSKP